MPFLVLFQCPFGSLLETACSSFVAFTLCDILKDRRVRVSRRVAKCRDMSRNVAKCREMSSCRVATWRPCREDVAREASCLRSLEGGDTKTCRDTKKTCRTCRDMSSVSRVSGNDTPATWTTKLIGRSNIVVNIACDDVLDDKGATGNILVSFSWIG